MVGAPFWAPNMGLSMVSMRASAMVGAPGRAGAISAAISTERGFLGVRRELGGEMCISSSGEVYEEARCASFSSA